MAAPTGHRRRLSSTCSSAISRPLLSAPSRGLLLLLLVLFLVVSSWSASAASALTGISQMSQALGKSTSGLAPWKMFDGNRASSSSSSTITSSTSKKTAAKSTTSPVVVAAASRESSLFSFLAFQYHRETEAKICKVKPSSTAAAGASTLANPTRSSSTTTPRRRDSSSFSLPIRGRAAAAAAAVPPPSASSPSFRFPSFRLSFPPLHVNKTLTFWGNMLAGAVSRSCAQTAMHPANVVKTLLQTKGSAELSNLNFQILTRGAGAQFALSLPHGALAFAVLEATKTTLSSWFPVGFAGPAFDFVSSAVSTTLCSVISTPQMVLTDRIMAGYYPNLINGVSTVMRRDGVRGLYAGWFAALAQKIPSYGLTWVFFQQLKLARTRWLDHEATNAENFGMGAFAAAATVCVMIPLDTVKTRIVTQAANPMAGVHYKGVLDCFTRVLREEGLRTFYAPLAPRLVSVVPMIGIQFGVYEFMKRTIAGMPEKPPREGGGERGMTAGWEGVKAWARRRVPSLAPGSESPLSEPPLSEIFDEIEDAN